MQKTQTPESGSARLGTKFGDIDTKGRTHQHQHNPALAVTENGQLPIGGAGKQGNLAGLGLRIETVLGKTALVETVEGRQLADLESLEIAFCLGNGELPRLGPEIGGDQSVVA